MPVKRRISKRFADLPEAAVRWLDGEDYVGAWFYSQSEADLAALWAANRDEVIAEHMEQWSGRPARWWQYDAPRQALGTYPGHWYDGQLPEPRRRVGGVGTPAFKVLAYVPRFAYGMPVDWISQTTADYYNGVLKDVNGNPANGGGRTTPFRGLPIDPDNPPRYESEATYLKRHGLFMPGELERMTAEDWEPETVEYEASPFRKLP